MYRSKPFLEFTRKRTPVLWGFGDTVYHHVKMLLGGGMGLKPPDSHALPVQDSAHRKLDSPGHSERSVFLDAGYSPDDVAALVEENISAYLESKGVDSTKLKIELMTEYLEENKL